MVANVAKEREWEDSMGVTQARIQDAFDLTMEALNMVVLSEFVDNRVETQEKLLSALTILRGIGARDG